MFQINPLFLSQTICNNREIFLKHYLTLPAQEVISIFNIVPAGRLPLANDNVSYGDKNVTWKLTIAQKPRIVH